MYNLFKDLANIPNSIGIYKIIINNNFYIGSSYDIKNRLGDHKSKLSRNKHCSRYLQNSFNKYGKNNLYVEILFTFNDTPSKIELLEKEEYYITSFKPKFNTHLTPTTNFNSKVSSKKCYQYSLNGTFIVSFSSTQEVKRKLNISCASACRGGINKSAGGYLWSYKKFKVFTKKYINNSKLSRIKEITCYDILGKKIKTYISIASCCRDLFKDGYFDGDCAAISGCAAGAMVSFNGFRFSYENIDQLDNTFLKKFKRGYPVKQLDENYNLIKVWNSNSEAEKVLGIKSQLSNYVNKNKKCKGYYWERL